MSAVDFLDNVFEYCFSFKSFDLHRLVKYAIFNCEWIWLQVESTTYPFILPQVMFLFFFLKLLLHELDYFIIFNENLKVNRMKLIFLNNSQF